MPFELAQLGKHVFFGAGFLSNIVLWSESGYFDGTANFKPLLHLWSLGIEEQFYIFWPALLCIAFVIKARWGRLIGLLFLGSFAINIALWKANIYADFYLPLSRFWEFLAGATLVVLPPIEPTPSVRSLISILGLAALFSSVALFAPEMRFPGWLALLPVAGAMAVIWAGPEATLNQIILSNRVAVLIGLISYPLYLWHWPLLSYAYIVCAGKPPTPLMAVALLATSFLLAWVTYHFVECAVRFGPHRRRRTQIVAACVAVIGGSGLAIWTANGFPGRFPGLDLRKINEAKDEVVFKPTKGMEVFDHDKTLVTRIGLGERKVALGGDSLLFHYGPRVQQLANEGELATTVYFVTGGSCAPVPGMIQQDDFKHCANLPSLLADLVSREKVQSVVLGASWLGYRDKGMLIERAGRQFPLNTDAGGDAFYSNLEDYVRMLQRKETKVYLVLESPIHGRFNPSLMITRGLTGIEVAPDAGKAIPMAELEAANATVDVKLRAVAEHTGALLLDPVPDVCGNGQDCSPFFGSGDPKFTDGMHLRPVFVREHLQFLDFLFK